MNLRHAKNGAILGATLYSLLPIIHGMSVCVGSASWRTSYQHQRNCEEQRSMCRLRYSTRLSKRRHTWQR